MAYELIDIERPAGNFAPGMSEMILLADPKKVLVFPGTTTSPTNPGDTLRLEGDITFGEGDGWVQVYATLDTVQLMLTKVGQKDSRGWNAGIDFWCPGPNPAFAELLAGDPNVIALVRQPDCAATEFIVLGDKCRSLGISGEYDSSLANDESGRNGWSGKIEGYLPKFYFYSGEITMKT